jgi:hypothetical protein
VLGTAKGSNNIAVTGPTAYDAPTPIRITANGGAFSGGKVRLVLYAVSFIAPIGRHNRLKSLFVPLGNSSLGLYESLIGRPSSKPGERR